MYDWLHNLSTSEILNGKDVNGNSYLKVVFALHQRHFGGTCESCPGKIAGYINRLRNLTDEQMANTEKPKYRFKKHSFSLLDKESGITYTNHNLTDEVAKKLISQKENRKNLFNIKEEKKAVETKKSETKKSSTKKQTKKSK